jgi:hypothetical protein
MINLKHIFNDRSNVFLLCILHLVIFGCRGDNASTKKDAGSIDISNIGERKTTDAIYSQEMVFEHDKTISKWFIDQGLARFSLEPDKIDEKTFFHHDPSSDPHEELKQQQKAIEIFFSENKNIKYPERAKRWLDSQKDAHEALMLFLGSIGQDSTTQYENFTMPTLISCKYVLKAQFEQLDKLHQYRLNFDKINSSR